MTNNINSFMPVKNDSVYVKKAREFMGHIFSELVSKLFENQHFDSFQQKMISSLIHPFLGNKLAAQRNDNIVTSIANRLEKNSTVPTQKGTLAYSAMSRYAAGPNKKYIKEI